MHLAIDPAYLGGAAALAMAVGGGIGWIFRGGLRDTTAVTIFGEIDKLKNEYKRNWKAAEDELRDNRTWRENATPILQQCANGDLELRQKIAEMKLLNWKASPKLTPEEPDEAP